LLGVESPGVDPLPRPTTEHERLDVLDACRGFSLGGIFLLNLAVFSGFVFMGRDAVAALPTARFDLPAIGLILWFGYGKFYSLFSLLFGIGFSLQLAAAERRGDVRVRLFRRRLLALVAIGAVHLYIWEGDILVLYALVGFFLMPFRRASDRTLLGTAVALVLAPVALQVLITATGGAADPGAPILKAGDAVLVATGFPAGTQPFPLLRDAGWTEFLRFQLSGAFFRYADLLSTGRPFKVLAIFLVGLWVGRSGMLRDVDPWLPILRRVRAWGFAVGLPAALAQAAFLASGVPADSWLKVLESLAYALGIAPLGLAYAATFAILWRKARWRGRLVVLAPAGRMALTNYLMQTVVAIAIFYGVGLRFMGRVGAVWWLPIAVAVLAVQAAISRWWLERYEFGPFEWIWRQITYGRRLPLVRTSRTRV
jgi:uncharacterized protein